MSRALVDLFVFDIAGTTVRDDGVVLRSFRAVLDRHGLERDDQWVRERMGWNKIGVFSEALSLNGRGREFGALLAEEFTAEIRRSMDKTPPAPLAGAALSLNSLAHHGVRTAFNTGYSASLAEEIVKRMGWTADAIVGSDLVARGRPAPDMIQLAMQRTGVTDARRVGVVGDTPSDLAAGMAAGCGFVIGVGHGTFSLQELAKHPHTHLLPDLTTLPEILHVQG